MGKRQPELVGMERETIKELDEAAVAYRDKRDERMQLTKDETELRSTLLERMKHFEQDHYRFVDGEETFDVVLETKTKVKVKKVSGSADEE